MLLYTHVSRTLTAVLGYYRIATQPIPWQEGEVIRSEPDIIMSVSSTTITLYTVGVFRVSPRLTLFYLVPEYIPQSLPRLSSESSNKDS